MSVIARAMDIDAEFDADVLASCAEGDGNAWRLLHERHYGKVSAFLRKIGVHERDIEDTTQEVFLQVHRSLGSFRHESEFSTWLYRICISQARSTRRRARVVEAVLRVLSLLSADQLVSTPSLSGQLARERIDRALSVLPEHERVTLILYELEGLPGKQIAKILGCPEATVWRRLHDARKAFKQAFADRR